MAGRASIVGAAATHVGKVREHNEDAHFFDADVGVFLVCDGMGGHAAGEVASAIAIRTIRTQWIDAGTQELIEGWLTKGSPDAKRELLANLRAGVTAAHDAIISEAVRDPTKKGMGTTLVGAVVVGNELVFAHAGDSRAYMVRDGIAMQLTEDHTLLARLLAAGIDVDQSGEGSRFKSMLTNALGIGEECKVSTFVVPLADGDRFMLCSDGISEYVPEEEVGEVLTKQPSPARAAQKLIELALERGGADNATAIVVRVLEAGETPQPAESIRRDNEAIAACPLWSAKLTPQQRLRALRIAIPRDHAIGARIPAHTLGDRVAWILVEGKVVLDGKSLEPGAFLYPESLIADSQAPDRDGLAVARSDVRALAFRADDFRELCEDDAELGEVLLERLAPLVAERSGRPARKPTQPTIHEDPEAQTAIATAIEKPNEEAIPVPIEGQRKTRPRRAPSPVSVELDQRFEALASDGPMPASKVASGERVPLILGTNKEPTPIEAAVMSALARPISESEIEIKVDADAMRGRVPERNRLPTEPVIETVIEMEAEEGSPDEPVVEVGTGGEQKVINSDGEVTETIFDTSSATMTISEPVEAPVAAAPPTDHSDPEIIIRHPTEPITSDDTKTTAGTINRRD